MNTKSKQTRLVSLHFVEHINILYDYSRVSNKLIFISNPYWTYMTLNYQRWKQSAFWRRTFIEPGPSHTRKMTGIIKKVIKGKIELTNSVYIYIYIYIFIHINIYKKTEKTFIKYCCILTLCESSTNVFSFLFVSYIYKTFFKKRHTKSKYIYNPYIYI